MTSLVYLDHAATSHPKPGAVAEAMLGALAAGGNPGRGGHRMALAAGRLVLGARQAVAALLGADPARLIWTASATASLNLAIKGTLQPGDHVITTAVEHNALRRPLLAAAVRGVAVTWLPAGADGRVDPADVRGALRPETRMVALAHAGNVTGALQPVADLAEMCRRHGAWLLLDAAQTAGAVPLHMERDGVHLLAAPGHKALLGPAGTGLLAVADGVTLRPIQEGGTGTMALAEEQPAVFPEGFESGTLNLPGLAGLGAAAGLLLAEGVARIRQREQDLAGALATGLAAIPGVTVFGPADPSRRVGVVAIRVAGLDPGELEERLDQEYGVIARAGLHCNPGSHALLGTLEEGGAVRLSVGHSTTPGDIAAAVAAVRALAG